MNHGDGKQCLEAHRETLPTEDQAAILFLEPGKGALSLEAWHLPLDRSATSELAPPDPCGHLRPNAPGAELLAQDFGVISFVRHDDLQAFPGASSLAGPPLDRVQPGDSLGTLIALGRCDASGPGHPRYLGEAVDENPLPFAAVGNPLRRFCQGEKAASTAPYCH